MCAGLGWDVVKVELPDGDALRLQQSRWSGGAGGAFAFVNAGKRFVRADGAALRALAAASDVVLGDLRDRALAVLGVGGDDLLPRAVRACVSPFGRVGAAAHWQATDLTLQAASGFMFLTGEHDEAPQQLPPYAAELAAGVTIAAAVYGALAAARDGHCRHLDLATVETLTAFTQAQLGRYVATGEIARREGAVKQALRMAPCADGFVYCAPGAVATAGMEGMVTLLGEPRLADARFATAAGRMDNFAEYSDLLFAAFSQRPAQDWCERAAALHLTFALVQTIDALFTCPQLLSRGYFAPRPSGGGTIDFPALPFRIGDGRAPTAAGAPLRAPRAPGADTTSVVREWLDNDSPTRSTRGNET